MEDAITRLRPAGGPGDPLDPVAQWRQEWEQDVAAAEAHDDGALAARRRDYGSYLFVCLDLLLAFAGQLILSIPLVLLVLLLFVATGHPLMVAGKESPEFAAWLTAPLFTLCGLFVTDGAMVLVVWYRLNRQKQGWSAVGLGRDLLR